jgi:hypothetical protein
MNCCHFGSPYRIGHHLGKGADPETSPKRSLVHGVGDHGQV